VDSFACCNARLAKFNRSAKSSFDLFARHHSGPQHCWHVAREVDDSAFDADTALATVENEIDAIAK
jgi:hypothetical protein